MQGRYKREHEGLERCLEERRVTQHQVILSQPGAIKAIRPHRPKPGRNHQTQQPREVAKQGHRQQDLRDKSPRILHNHAEERDINSQQQDIATVRSQELQPQQSRLIGPDCQQITQGAGIGQG